MAISFRKKLVKQKSNETKNDYKIEKELFKDDLLNPNASISI